jgi:transcription elongation factor Elf1
MIEEREVHMPMTGTERNKRCKLRKQGLIPPITRMTGTERNRKSTYGLSPEMFNTLLRQQEFKCAVCKKSIDTSCHVDHNHVTGKVRGLLCPKCNQTIGWIEQSNLQAILAYLDATNG